MLLALPLAACSAPDVSTAASKCQVSQAILKQAVTEASHLPPYQGRRVGKCELIVDSDSGGHVAVITPEIMYAVEKMK